MTQPAVPTDYLGIGRQLARLLGSSLEGPSGEALKELARAYDPSANEARISAEVFLFHKYLIVQTCVGMFPGQEVERVIGGLFAALNERATGLEFSQERQNALEQRWSISWTKAATACFGSDRSHSFAKTCARSNAHRISGPAARDRRTRPALASPRPSIIWCRR